MSVHEFHFGITLSGAAVRGQHDEILTDVLRSVLGQVGLTGDAADRLIQQLRAARRASPAGAPCDLRFSARGGELQIALSQSGADWRTSCPLPRR